MFKLSFVMLVKIHSDDSDNDGERNPTAPECFCWWGVEASAMAFDSRGSTHRAFKKREQDERRAFRNRQKNICVGDFEICYFLHAALKNISNSVGKFRSKQQEKSREVENIFQISVRLSTINYLAFHWNEIWFELFAISSHSPADCSPTAGAIMSSRVEMIDAVNEKYFRGEMKNEITFYASAFVDFISWRILMFVAREANS